MTQENTPQNQFIFSLDQEFKMPNREFYEALVVATDRVFHDALKHSELLGMVHEQGPDRDTFGLKILRCNVGRFYTYKGSDVSCQFGSKSSSDPDPIEKGVFEKATSMVVNTRGLPWKERICCLYKRLGPSLAISGLRALKVLFPVLQQQQLTIAKMS